MQSAGQTGVAEPRVGDWMQIQEENLDADGGTTRSISDLEQAAVMASSPGPATNAGEEEEAEDDQTADADSQLRAFAGRINELCDEMQALAASISKVKGGHRDGNGVDLHELASHMVSHEVSEMRWMVAACVERRIPGDGDQEESSEEETEMIVEEEEAIVDDEEEDDAEGPADCYHHDGKSMTEWEEEQFAAYREGWEQLWGIGLCNAFEYLTLLSPMLFTHVTPGCIPDDAVLGRTFQIYSIKFTELKGFRWPLKVYGVVAARDEVDRHRNPLFLRPRGDCQILTRKDPFLHLTGPCRPIMSVGRIEIEIQLRVKRGARSKDRALISQIYTFNGDNEYDLRSCLVDNHFCTMELSFERLEKSVQATIFGVQVVDREAPSPFEYGVRVACSSLPDNGYQDDVYQEAVLLDSKHGTRHAVRRGYLNLSRQVISVELRGRLKVCIQAYTRTDEIAVGGHVFIVPQASNTSWHICAVGGSEVEITVAWSLLVEDEIDIKINGCVDPSEGLPPMHPDLLEKMGLSE